METQAPLYTAYNIWYEHPDRIYCVNYKKGSVIPAGTPIENPQLNAGWKPRLDFTVSRNNMRFTIHFQSKFHPGVTPDQWGNKIIGPRDLAALTEGMNDHEKTCIERAVVEPGMSKAAVLVSFGYPPEHFTPTLERNVWYYWSNRFMKKEVRFSPEGITETAF